MKDFIFLYGPPGAGKSAAGQVLASSLKLPFIDLDHKIEEESGRDISDIFEADGEAHFRKLEIQALKLCVSGKTSVIALGGGALLEGSNRKLASDYGRLVCLRAAPEVLRSRLSHDANERPLLREGALEKLIERRKEHYETFSFQVDTGGLTLEEVGQEIQIQLGRFHVSGMGPGYDVIVQDGGLQNVGELIKSRRLGPPYAIISDTNVSRLYSDPVIKTMESQGFSAAKITFPAGESNKTLQTVSQLWEALLEVKMERGGTVIALGGGVSIDMAGFAAATFMRGVTWAAIPTSLLAMVDASLGGKTGLNLPQGKNLVGAFHPPRLVLADPGVLKTLPDVEIINGLAEVVKHAVIGGGRLMSLCQEGMGEMKAHWAELVARAMHVKIKIIQEDPFEDGSRAILNFGHTIGHGLEVLSEYELRHGEAVSIGMVAEARLAEKLEIAQPGLATQLKEILTALNLPTEIPPEIDRQVLAQTLEVDKKREGGVICFVLPMKVGDVRPGFEIKGLFKLLAEV